MLPVKNVTDSVHTIGLMGPWEYATARLDAPPQGEWHRVHLPLREAEPPWHPVPGESLWLRRFFHSPTGLQAQDAVLLVFSGWPSFCQVVLNESPLARLDPQQAAWDVTHLLQRRNCLQLRLAPEACRGRWPWQAHLALQIRPGLPRQ